MGLNKTLRFTIIGGLFLLPFLSLIVAGSLYFPYITGKNFLFRTIVEIIFVCFVALSLRDPIFRPKWKSPITISLLIFIFIIFFADLFGENFHKSFWSNYERMEGFITFLHLLALFFISTSIFNEKLWRRWFHTSFIVSICLGFSALIQHFHDGVERPAAALGNSTYLGALMLFNIFLMLFYLFRVIRAKNLAWKWWALGYSVVILFDFYILFLSGTRGAFLGLVAGFIFIAFVLAFFEREQKILKRSGLALLILIIVGLSFAAIFKNAGFVKNNFFLSRFSAPISAVLTLDVKSFLEKEGRGRLLIWQAAIQGVKERPILGWGQENFNYVFNKYYTPAMYTEEQWFDRSHNVILDWLTQGGILGLLSYLSLFGFLIYSIWRKGVSNFSLADKTVLTGLLIAYFIHNFFVFDNVTSYIIFFALLAYVNQNYAKLEEKKRWNIHPDIGSYAITPIVGIVVLFSFYFGVWKPYLAAGNLIKALVYQNQAASGAAETVPTANDSFQKALSYNSFGSAETREQFLSFLPVAFASSLDPQAKTDILTVAQTEMAKQLADTPNDARYFLFYGFTLDRLGDYSGAQKYLSRARELSPKKQTILFEIGLNYISQKQYGEALSIMEEAYQSAPDYQEAKIYYIIGLIYAGKKDEADALLDTVDPSIIAADGRLLKAFFDTKQFQKIINLYHQKMVSEPSNIQNYLGAAAFELSVSERQEAIADLQKAIDFFSKTADSNSSLIVSTLKKYITDIRAGKNPLPLQ